MDQVPQKPRASAFIPYRKRNDEFEVFLQRRSADARSYPGFLGFFGGHKEEDETPEQTLLRELQEELRYTPSAHRFFGLYESHDLIKDVFIEEVSADFDALVTVLEGDYGRFFSESDVQQEPIIRDKNRAILKDLFTTLWNPHRLN